jgi:Dockerin type I domain
MKKALLTAVALISIFLSLPQPIHADSSDSTCIVTGDINGDAVISIMDALEMLYVIRDSASSIPLFQFDFNTDCVIDSADIEAFWLHFLILPIRPIFPLETCCNPTVNVQCCIGLLGNVDGSASDNINIVDVTFLVNFLFAGGPPPPCIKEANLSGDVGNNINIVDLTKFVGFMFGGLGNVPNCYGSVHWPYPGK